MEFQETRLPGVICIALEPLEDARGYFARTWCDREARARGLRTPMVQDSVAYNHRRGTLRGLHYHAPPFAQVRLVRCIAGAAFVVAVDLRTASDTRLRTVEITLDETSPEALYVPPGVALGYQTLTDRTTIAYKMAEYYDPAFERGLRWNDPRLSIDWPDRRPILNERDASYPDYEPVMAPGQPGGVP
jgi:dTDP-4-dehydrorhamnose 3,5-epimerase